MPEAVRERRVDLERLLRLALGALLRDVPPRPRVVEPVGELDDEHPDVPRHRDDHLAHRLGLRGLTVGHLVELGDTVDEHGDLVAEVTSQRLQAVCRVLHRVVQQGGRQRGRCHPELGEDRRHGQRVGDVVVAGAALLAVVCTLRHGIRPLDQREVGLGVGAPDHLQERFEDGVLGDAVAADEGEGGAGSRARRDAGGGCPRCGRRDVLRHAGSVVAGPAPTRGAPTAPRGRAPVAPGGSGQRRDLGVRRGWLRGPVWAYLWTARPVMVAPSPSVATGAPGPPTVTGSSDAAASSSAARSFARRAWWRAALLSSSRTTASLRRRETSSGVAMKMEE